VQKPINDEAAHIKEKNLRKRFRGRAPEITYNPDGTVLIKLKGRKSKNWIHR